MSERSQSVKDALADAATLRAIVAPKRGGKALIRGGSETEKALRGIDVLTCTGLMPAYSLARLAFTAVPGLRA